VAACRLEGLIILNLILSAWLIMADSPPHVITGLAPVISTV
jgi:hypothetical protein